MTDFADHRLHDGGRAPNPRRVRVFLAEKGVAIPLVPVDIGRGEHLEAPFAALNPMKTLPVLVLPDGTAIAESMAICRYVEALVPEPNLFGETPREIAAVEMWNRRMELHLYNAVAAVFRHTHPAMAAREAPQVPAWGEANRDKAMAALDLLDDALATRAFVAGDRFTVADITTLVAIDFMKVAKLQLQERHGNVRRWHAAVAARPSAAA